MFNEAGALSSADVHVAETLGRLADERDERVLLAVAFTVQAVRHGSVCLHLPDVRRTAAAEAEDLQSLDALPWPDVNDWYAACRASRLVVTGADGELDRPVRLQGGLLYLDRYWRQEESVRSDLSARARRPLPHVDGDRLRAALAQFFPGDAPDHQRLAAAACATGWLTVVAGGPGTGKTTTVARMLALLSETLERPPRVALAAPTGKAAARMSEALAAESRALADKHPVPTWPAASTLHRLLGVRPDSGSRFRHDRDNRLPYDVVVVDETSMVSLTLMARLLEALRPDARLVLLGDPDQLASVEAGAVLGDLVQRLPRTPPDARLNLLARVLPRDVDPVAEVQRELRTDVVRLRTTHRFSGAVGALAEAIRRDDADAALAVLRSGEPGVELVEVASLDKRVPNGLDGLWADVESAGLALTMAARAGNETAALAALERHRLVCAHRRGPYGVARWSAEVERRLASTVDGYAAEGEWYPGRPLLVTANDYEVRLFNGETGVVVARPDGGIVAVFGRGAEQVRVAPARLSAVQTLHAMTVHRGQGSQFDRVSVLLPPADSPLLTRELFYTAVTRATQHVRVVGTEASVRAAIGNPVVRASGLRLGSPTSEPT